MKKIILSKQKLIETIKELSNENELLKIKIDILEEKLNKKRLIISNILIG